MLFLLIISFSTVHPMEVNSVVKFSQRPLNLAHYDPKMLQQSFRVTNMCEQKFHFLHRTLWTELDFSQGS